MGLSIPFIHWYNSFIFNVRQLHGWTSEVGQGQSQGKFFLVGRSDRGKVRGSFFWFDGGRRKEGSFYFALEPPYFKSGWRAEVGGGQSQGKFFPGWRAEGGGRRAESDKGKILLPFRKAPNKSLQAHAPHKISTALTL